MTYRRKQVLGHIRFLRERGYHVSLHRIVRECDISDNRTALRIIRDLDRFGLLDELSPLPGLRRA